MKIELDENLPVHLTHLLVTPSHDVHTVPGENLVSPDDGVIVGVSFEENRIKRP